MSYQATEHLQREQERLARQKNDFDEAPGEAEAEAVSEAFLKGAVARPGTLARSLDESDGTVRRLAVTSLQRSRGNTFVQRLVSERGSPGRLVGLSQADMVQEVQRRKGGGSELAAVDREPLEQFMGANLAGVRIHTDAEAVALNRELDARAFTVGRDVFLGGGQYKPGSREGQALLAHELTHVGQQGGLAAPAAQRKEVDPEELKKAAEAKPSGDKPVEDEELEGVEG